MTDYTLRAITATAGSASSCAVSTLGTIIERPVLTRARPRTAPGVILIEALSESLDNLRRNLGDGDHVAIEFTGVSSDQIGAGERLSFRRLIDGLYEKGVGFSVAELPQPTPEMKALRDKAAFAASMGQSGMARR